jgi:hypothetical protein
MAKSGGQLGVSRVNGSCRAHAELLLVHIMTTTTKPDDILKIKLKKYVPFYQKFNDVSFVECFEELNLAS